MEAFLGLLEMSAVAAYFRGARWGYASLSAAHVLGLALLVGAIVPMNLRLLGLWPGIDRTKLARVLLPVAASGLALAVATGVLLFSVRATEYAAVPFLQVKLALVAVGTVAALFAHWAHGPVLAGAPPARLRAHALISLICWLAALVLGRLIAFAD